MIQENVSLKQLNTFGISVYAQYFTSCKDKNSMPEILTYAKRLGLNATSDLMILGGGSNILFTRNVEGLLIKNEITGLELVEEDDQFVYLKAGAAVNWHQFVMYCIDKNYAGVENLALIPGLVGASPMQNIGAYGVEIKDVFYSLEAYDLIDEKWVTLFHADCEFGYRESVFKNRYKGRFIITSVTFKLRKNPVLNTKYGAIEIELERMGVKNPSIQSIATAVIRIRQSKLPDPAKIGNAGSFFKNPQISLVQFNQLVLDFPEIVGYKLPGGDVKLAAGWLIEQCGWKGFRRKDAGCHEKQALVLVNYGNAQGNEILTLSDEIMQSVKQKFNVQLEREVNIY